MIFICLCLCVSVYVTEHACYVGLTTMNSNWTHQLIPIHLNGQVCSLNCSVHTTSSLIEASQILFIFVITKYYKRRKNVTLSGCNHNKTECVPTECVRIRTFSIISKEKIVRNENAWDKCGIRATRQRNEPEYLGIWNNFHCFWYNCNPLLFKVCMVQF